MLRLKEETAQAHKETEAHSRGGEIMSGTLDLDGYIDILQKNYQLHQHFEDALRNIEGLNELFKGGIGERWRTASLIADLRLLGQEPMAYPDSQELARPGNLRQALGCMYVLEGSTLGGAVILKKLQRIPSISEHQAFGFYGFYGPALGKKWQEFGDILTNFATNREAQDEVVAFASATFESAKRIFMRPIERIES